MRWWAGGGGGRGGVRFSGSGGHIDGRAGGGVGQIVGIRGVDEMGGSVGCIDTVWGGDEMEGVGWFVLILYGV